MKVGEVWSLVFDDGEYIELPELVIIDDFDDESVYMQDLLGMGHGMSRVAFVKYYRKDYNMTDKEFYKRQDQHHLEVFPEK